MGWEGSRKRDIVFDAAKGQGRQKCAKRWVAWSKPEGRAIFTAALRVTRYMTALVKAGQKDVVATGVHDDEIPR